jgi:hypothetical protein
MEVMTYPKAAKAMRIARTKADILTRELAEKIELIQEDKPYPKQRYFAGKRADFSVATERMAALNEQDIDLVIRNYRVVAAAPNLADIEASVRNIAHKLGHDGSELFADVMDNICESKDWPIPLEPRHLQSLFIRRARTIGTTGKYRKNRIKSRKTLPIQGLERQENSPSYNPYIGEKGQSLPTISGDRVHYIGHKAPGNPEQNAFRKSGRIDQYLTDIGLEALSMALIKSVRWTYNRRIKGRYFAITWTKLARQFGCKTRTEVNEFRENVTALIAGIDSEWHPRKVWEYDRYVLVDKPHPGNVYGRNNYIVESEKTGFHGSYIGHMSKPLYEGISPDVVTAEWKVSLQKRAKLVAHYREHRSPDNCRTCKEIEADIEKDITTNRALGKAYLSTK